MGRGAGIFAASLGMLEGVIPVVEVIHSLVVEVIHGHIYVYEGRGGEGREGGRGSDLGGAFGAPKPFKAEVFPIHRRGEGGREGRDGKGRDSDS